MRRPLALKSLSVVALGIVLAYLSPVTTGMLLCIGDGEETDCCPEPPASQVGVDDATRILDGSDCGCCITVDAAPATPGAASAKVSVDVLSESDLHRNGSSRTVTNLAQWGHHDPGGSRLSSLRTVVLLI